MKIYRAAKRRGESGFAILLVFAMAATVALMLYLELPRVAFEAQRDREGLLIERGEEYKRAIQLYFRKFKTYPTSVDALENTNNVRFLRRRYADPLTGKDDWRLIHVGPGGVFTDSITNKPKGDKKPENQNNFISEGASLAGDVSTNQQSGPAFRRRPSDGGQPQTGSDPNAQPPTAGLPAGTSQLPGTNQPPVDPGSNPAQIGTQPTPGGENPNQPYAPGTGQQPVAPPTPVSAFPGIPGVPFNPGTPSQSGSPSDPSTQAPNTGNQTPFGQQPGVDPSQQGQNQAADLIRGLLTRPRAMPGSQQPGSPLGGGGAQIAAGSIAGVASKVERHGIKIYNEREKYNEWEFIYDFSKDRTGAGRLAGQVGAGDPRLGQQQPGQPLTNTPGFGASFGSGTGSDQTTVNQPTAPGMQPGPLPPPATPPQ